MAMNTTIEQGILARELRREERRTQLLMRLVELRREMLSVLTELKEDYGEVDAE